MEVSIGLKLQVQEKVQECVTKVLGAIEADLLVIPVTYRDDMQDVAGYAYRDTKRIEINAPLFLLNKKEFLSQIIPHEIAHVLQDVLYPEAKLAHGKEWKKIMQILGCPADTFHLLDVSSVAENTHRYSCGCSEGNFFHMVHKSKHEKILKGARLECVACKTRIIHHPKGEDYGVK